jgi:hypothetical protein
MKRGRTQLAAVVVLALAVSGTAFAQPAAQPGPSTAESATGPAARQPQIVATANPQALPNDGRSETSIQVEVRLAGQPAPGQVVKAAVASGGGALFASQATTDSTGIARFQFRAGIMPDGAVLNFTTADAVAQTALEIPIAPMAYLDVLLLTPEEYKAHRDRQVAAAPIYTLAVTVFPEQLAADGGSIAALAAQLNMADGPPAPGVPLKVEIISGEGQLLVDRLATGSNGRLEFHFTAGYVPGTVTIRVTEPSTGLSASVNIILVKTGPARIELYYMDPLLPGAWREGAVLPADGITCLPMLAKVTDLLGLPLPGAEVKLELLDSSNGWLQVLDPVSDAQGHVPFAYYAGMSPGKVRLRAYVANGMRKTTLPGASVAGVH